MSARNNDTKSQPDTWIASLIGGLYFLLTGLQLIFSDIPLEWAIPAWLRTTDWLFLFGLLAPAIGFALGWALGFPRWSYAYTGGLLVYSLYLVNTSTSFWYNLGYEKQAWGWRAWIPFLLAAVVGFLLSHRPSTALRSAQGDEIRAERRAQPAVEAADHSIVAGGSVVGVGGSLIQADSPLPPAAEGQAAVSAAGLRAALGLRTFFTNIRRDPTLATYLMFAWMPLIIFTAFDEIARPYSLVFKILLTTLILAWIGSIAYWLPRDGVYLPGALRAGVIIAIVMLYPLWLMHVTKPGQKAEGS